MKKIIALFLVSAALLSFAACGKAEEEQVERGEDVFLRGTPVWRLKEQRALAHLEQNLFRLGRKPYVSDSQEERDQLQLYHFARPAEELVFAAKEVFCEWC